MISKIVFDVDGTPQTYCLEDRIYICAEEVPRYDKTHPRECPPQYRGRGDTYELNGRVRSSKRMMLEIGWAATNRDWYPNKLAIPPHGDRLNHTPFPQPIISQRNP